MRNKDTVNYYKDLVATGLWITVVQVLFYVGSADRPDWIEEARATLRGVSRLLPQESGEQTFGK